MAFPDEVARKLGSALTDPLQELVAIGPYEQLPATCNDHDPRSFEVAKRVADLIESHLPDVRVEHVGSTAVPGCAGKGVVDLMILYPPGQLPEVREGLDALGFQRQTGRNPFPEDRPLRLGSIEFDSTRFRLHAHVIAVDSPEVLELRTFRDRLRGEPLLLEQYVALKRKIIAQGVTDSLDYSIRKGEFIAGILRDRTIPKVNVSEKLALFHDHWSPKAVGELNGQHVKLVKFQGEFVWHKHDHDDELFLVVKGRFRMEFRDRHVWLEEGEFLIVPRGVEHRPVAEEEVHVLLFEPAGTLNTGDVRDERTVEEPERI
ncbi:MAG: GrpB family protein [Isosphaeraceae bacterium]